MAGVVRAVLAAAPASAVRWMRVFANPLSSTKEVRYEQSFRFASLRPVPPLCGYHVQSAMFQRSSADSGPERFPEEIRNETGKTSVLFTGITAALNTEVLPDRGYITGW